MIVFDTDVFSIIQREQGKEYVNLVGKLPTDGTDVVYVTIISFEEQMRGWLALGARKKNPANK